MQEKRRRTRVEIGEIEAHIEAAGIREKAEVINLSLKGILCKSREHLTPEAPCVVSFPAIGIEVQGTVVRNDGQETAIDFKAMDADSFRHLKRLVQLHAEEPDQVDREIGTPAFD